MPKKWAVCSVTRKKVMMPRKARKIRPVRDRSHWLTLKFRPVFILVSCLPYAHTITGIL